MSKQILIVLVFVVALIVFALSGLGKFIDLNLIDLGVSNSQTRRLESQKTDIVRIVTCQPGSIAFLPSLGGTIKFDPNTFRISRGETLTFVNRDDKSHKIGVSTTDISLEIAPTEFGEIDTSIILGSGPWSITCDNMNLGDKGPLLYLIEPY